MRDVVETYLKTLTEREFDAPLLALLATQGFNEIHFIHGSFEFGKDVIAKRADSGSGDLVQYSIQSKAGDIGMGGWREVRPQLEEAEYNTRAHPGYDANLPRVAVLLTTGRLKGAAAVDAQEFKERAASRGLAGFEVWDGQRLADWMCHDPSVGLLGTPSEPALMTLVADILALRVTETALERYTRAWLISKEHSGFRSRCAIEAALLSNALRRTGRTDLAALTSLHLLRAALVSEASSDAQDEVVVRVADAARRWFAASAEDLLAQAEPLLSDPIELARETLDRVGLISYAVVSCRLIELLALLVIVGGPEETIERARRAVHRLASDHPGCARVPSDQFAASIVPVVSVLASDDMEAARAFLRNVGLWLLDRHDPEKAGLGLGSLDESEEVAVERLLGGGLSTTLLEIRRMSYLATVLLDLCLLSGGLELYAALRTNFETLQVVPYITAANEHIGQWRRGGTGVHLHPRVEYGATADPAPIHHSFDGGLDPRNALLLGAVCRSRHDVGAIRAWLSGQVADMN